MPISDNTIKRLYAKSHNQCAMPVCKKPLVIGETHIAEICHIRARRKGGARYDASLTEEQKNVAANLILLCPTCHTLADKDKTGKYTVAYLEAIKAQHERNGAIELSLDDARHALAILAKHNAKNKRGITGSPVSGGAQATAATGGVAVSIGGNNQGDIKIHIPAAKSGKRGYLPNSIGADANLTGYVDYLCEQYVKYMSQLEPNPNALRGRIGKHIKTKFRLAKRTRNDLPAERFHDLVEFLYDKLAATPVGGKHVRNGTKLCSSFDEWRTTTR